MDKAMRIAHYRASLGIGLLAAKAKVEREDLLAEIDGAKTIDDVKVVLRQLASR